MEQLWAALDGAWKVLAIGLVLGAGLPTMFGLGIRALAWGAGGDAEVHEAGVLPKPHLLGRLLAYTMFALVVLSVLLGIGYIVAHGFGFQISFDGWLPVLAAKH